MRRVAIAKESSSRTSDMAKRKTKEIAFGAPASFGARGARAEHPPLLLHLLCDDERTAYRAYTAASESPKE
jgi:hypothetical protein